MLHLGIIFLGYFYHLERDCKQTGYTQLNYTKKLCVGTHN